MPERVPQSSRDSAPKQSGSATIVKRARSADQKLERREAILRSAGEHLEAVGFDAFSMASLARSVGLAKGTLYLYFQTREEILLALAVEKVAAWAHALEAALEPGMSDARLAEAFLRTAEADRTLMPLMLRLNSVIEHNVSIDALVDSKRALRNRFGTLAGNVAAALDATPEQGADVLNALAALLLGAAQSDQGPTLAEEDLPDDIRTFVDTFATDRVFLPNARRIIRSIRAGD